MADNTDLLYNLSKYIVVIPIFVLFIGILFLQLFEGKTITEDRDGLFGLFTFAKWGWDRKKHPIKFWTAIITQILIISGLAILFILWIISDLSRH